LCHRGCNNGWISASIHTLDPFFSVVMEGLSKYTDGEHYFDTLADDVLARISLPHSELVGSDTSSGRPHVALFRVRQHILLERGDALAAHPSADGHVVTLEYEVHGKILKTGVAHDNRFVSIAFIEKRKIVRWRDYMDSLAAWTALTRP
jgi:ketosteroid isomerase-like protein